VAITIRIIPKLIGIAIIHGLGISIYFGYHWWPYYNYYYYPAYYAVGFYDPWYGLIGLTIHIIIIRDIMDMVGIAVIIMAIGMATIMAIGWLLGWLSRCLC
jgi:hypothetical protein